MLLPDLTAQDCNDVLDIEISLGSVVIPNKVNNKITYNLCSGVYYVYENGGCVYSNTFQQNALTFYNNLNKKVDL